MPPLEHNIFDTHRLLNKLFNEDADIDLPKEAVFAMLIDLDDFVLIDTTTNPARTYIYTKKDDRICHVMIHNLKLFAHTTWSVWYEMVDGKLESKGTQNHWKCLPEGLFISLDRLHDTL